MNQCSHITSGLCRHPGLNPERARSYLLRHLLTVCLTLLALVSLDAHADCPAGEDQCLPGFVWREAFPGDHVCVSGSSRAQADNDNGQAATRTEPGSELCKAGFVWREAEPSDRICVAGSVRAQSANENRLAPQRRDPACMQARTATSLGILVLNVAGLGHGTDMDTNVPWETRAKRLAASVRRNRLLPDVVTLTELHAWLITPPVRSCGRGFAVGAGDYDQIDILLDELRSALGITYRVAYLTGDEAAYGVVPCQVYGAQAMLYNPARLIHVPPPPHIPSFRHDGRNALVGTPHLRRSLPLCARGTRLTPLETLIDGTAQTDKCGRPTPSGPAFAVFGSNDDGHISSSARFAFVSEPAQTIDIFNIHPAARKEWEQLPSILRLIDAITPPPYAGTSALYPPILAGDFNLFAGVEGQFPLFAKVAGADPDVMAVGLGLADRFPSRLRARAVQTLVLPDRPAGVPCGDPRYLISNHCGLFVRFDRDGPEAAALRGAFIDGPADVISGEAYRLQATASGGGPDLAFLWTPGGATSASMNAEAGAPNQVQAWSVTITDRTSGLSQSATHSVRYLAAPDSQQCQANCVAERNGCMASVPQPDGPSPQQCFSEFRQCQAQCAQS